MIFFARYEASNYGSTEIDTEHLFLGILRETAQVRKMLPLGAADAIRAQIEARTPVRPKVSTSVDLPLSDASKRILKYGMEEAERLNHRHIGTEHLFLGLLQERGCFAAELLEPFGVKLEQLRTNIEVRSAYDEAEQGLLASRYRGMATPPGSTITIHGSPFEVEYVCGAVRRCRLHNWLWRKTSWKPRDMSPSGSRTGCL
jgi:ATP-dependent Clp protease ATP-binding subunit ClpC